MTCSIIRLQKQATLIDAIHMKIEDFWNQAFIAALARLPVAEAKQEATNALNACIDHWSDDGRQYHPQLPQRWSDAEITSIPRRGKHF
ncbi:hypothetical protein LN450_06045 [Xanthomonas euvesicatoria pv. euvesicatoria]|uniref:hypothetical protein n=1 Tax=Xanthomonas euvesicatoria TaxID=456327 RepID=UPI0012D77A2A|nr:hypothetical protein [Xanthomonas euvesicatoria]MCC8613064.1 hypothetical protein [Xanthomonas euvesicatoria pv. euvesicatoria]